MKVQAGDINGETVRPGQDTDDGDARPQDFKTIRHDTTRHGTQDTSKTRKTASFSVKHVKAGGSRPAPSSSSSSSRGEATSTLPIASNRDSAAKEDLAEGTVRCRNAVAPAGKFLQAW